MDDKNTKKTLGTDPYKGVRDFYPEDLFIQTYIFGQMRKTVESFGYVEYAASILEPSELYAAKTGQEIVHDQTYSFKDRGDRDVTLRPEMTPTVSRMVAARKRELSFPLRWYSIPNLFRYEKPQRGRLREHFQLNVDLFGSEHLEAEIEIISVAHAIMHSFGASSKDFVIKINNRKILNYILSEVCKLKDEDSYQVTKLIDKKNKISADDFKKSLEAILGDTTDLLIALLSATTIDEFAEIAQKHTSEIIVGVSETRELLANLFTNGIPNAIFDPTLARGFDYYTGIVFEVFDVNPENARSLFGGGRYDDLLSIFGTDKVPAVGFGMGDVTIRDFLESHTLLPEYRPNIHIALCSLSKSVLPFTEKYANTLRSHGINVAVDISGRKIAQQIQWADKQKIPFIICIGENEVSSNTFNLKELSTGTETTFTTLEKVAEFLKIHI